MIESDRVLNTVDTAELDRGVSLAFSITAITLLVRKGVVTPEEAFRQVEMCVSHLSSEIPKEAIAERVASASAMLRSSIEESADEDRITIDGKIERNR
jgi:hypothetical protein